jgi:AraC-like DNA-binding protein
MKSFLKTRSVYSGMVRLLDVFCDQNNLKAPVHNIYDLDDRVVFGRWLKKLKYVDQQYGKEGIGLEIAKLCHPSHLGVSLYIAASCKNLKNYTELTRQYISVWYDYMYKDVKTIDNQIQISWEKPAYYSAGLHIRETAISEELQVAIIYQRLLKLFPGNYEVFTKVELAIPKPKNIKLYENYFNCPVSFDGERTLFRIPENVFEADLSTADPMLLHIVKKPAEEMFNSMPKHTKFLENVYQSIIKSIKAQEPQISVVAGHLNMSTRVLQMTLKDHGVRFQHLLNKARLTLAKQYLLQNDISIVDISSLLGYQEQTSFNRVFKNWTGHSPMRWRSLNIGKLTENDISLDYLN